MVYERWLDRITLAAEEAESSSSPPLLTRGDPGGGLRRDLIRHGASEDDAERGAADAVKKSKDAAERWAKRCEEIVDEEDDVDGDGAFDIVTSEEGLGEDVGLGVVWYRNPGN